MTNRAITLLAICSLLLGACGSGAKVGNERLLEGVNDEGGDFRFTPPPIPEEDQETGALTVGDQPTPPPAATPVPTPPPQEVQYFDIELIADTPYYRDSSGEGQIFRMSMQSVLRVTNKDTTPDRPCRSFTEQEGRFHSGCLAPGANWTYRFPNPGTWRITDEGLPFASATLEVR